MLVTYRNLDKLAYPVFMIPSGTLWDKEDGLLLLNDRIVDDTNMPGDTLGIRRLQTHTAIEDLQPLNEAIETPVGLIKNKPHTYIDSLGTPFVYKKTKFFDLKYYKVKDVTKHGTFSMLKLYGVKRDFRLIRPPEPGRFWAGVLHINKLPWLLYDFSIESKPPSRKKA